jgi:hypothetical protein
MSPNLGCSLSPPPHTQWSFIFIFVQEIILILKNVKFFFALGLSILGNGKNIKRTAFLRSKKVKKRP